MIKNFRIRICVINDFQEYFSNIVAVSYIWRKLKYPDKTSDLTYIQ